MDQPADGIIQCSKDFGADLIIVIGTHSRTGFDRLLMGSVAEDVVRHSEIPVLVVPFEEGRNSRWSMETPIVICLKPYRFYHGAIN